VIAQITCNNPRSLARKQALYRRIVDKTAAGPGLRPEQVPIVLM